MYIYIGIAISLSSLSSLSVYIYTHTHARARAHTHTRVAMYIYLSIYRCRYVHIYIHIYTHIHTHTHTHVYIHIHIGVAIHVYFICMQRTPASKWQWRTPPGASSEHFPAQSPSQKNCSTHTDTQNKIKSQKVDALVHLLYQTNYIELYCIRQYTILDNILY